jgi:hypothetical protein
MCAPRLSGSLTASNLPTSDAMDSGVSSKASALSMSAPARSNNSMIRVRPNIEASEGLRHQQTRRPEILLQSTEGVASRACVFYQQTCTPRRRGDYGIHRQRMLFMEFFTEGTLNVKPKEGASTNMNPECTGSSPAGAWPDSSKIYRGATKRAGSVNDQFVWFGLELRE